MPVSDLILMKRLAGTCWLGLRMPSGLNVNYDNAKGLEVPATWGYSVTSWPTNLQSVFLPDLDKEGSDENPQVKLKSPWTSITFPVAAAMPLPFKGLEQTLERFGEKFQIEVAGTPDEPMKVIQGRFEALRTNASMPLKLMQVYREIGSMPFGTGMTPEDFQDAAQKRLLALAGEGTTVPIEMLSGLLFLATADGVPAPADPATHVVDCDSVDASTSQPVALTLKAIQLPERVALQLSVAKGVLTNESVVQDIDAASLGTSADFAPTFRLVRTLGIEQRPSLQTGHIAILRKRPTSPGLSGLLDAPTGEFRGWEQRPFQPSDAVGQALVGELLNYQVSLFNAHGRRTHQGRLMVARQSLDRPAPPTRGMARLIVASDGKPIRIDFWLGLPQTELEQSAGLGGAPMLRETASVVFYRSDTPLIPTGFYGDADDAALATARVLSDLDPAALLASGAADFPSGDAQGVPDPALASYGLNLVQVAPLRHYTTGRPNPDPSAWIYAPPAPSDRSTTGEKPETDRLQWWTQVDLTDGMDGLVLENSGLRLYVALQRQVDPTMLQPRQRAPESPLVPLALEIVVEGVVKEVVKGVAVDFAKEAIVATVQHFERFGKVDLAHPALGDGLARIVCTDPEPAAPGGSNFPQLQVVIDHAAVVAPPEMSMAVGGYRLWVRDLAVPKSAFRMEAVVQALPPMVKAYAPIDSGRQWSAPAVVVNATAVARPNDFRLDRNIGFEGAVVEASSAKPLEKEFGKAMADAVPKPGAAMLLIMRSLAMAGQACEVLLSVAQLNRLERSGSGAVPAFGNWLFMRDQNGRHLGRAWCFWGALAVEKFQRCYEITEEPNAQDTVALDDFGHIHWNWMGLKDGWRHELEWVIEPLARHAPLMQRIHTAFDKSKEVFDRYRMDGTRAKEAGAPNDEDPRAPVELTLPPTEDPPNFDNAPKHRIVVQRRKPLDGGFKFGAVQKITAQEDRFVFSVFAPASFREATYNSGTRTAQGVLSMAVSALERKFLWADQFPISADVRKLIRAWCGDPLPAVAGTEEKFSGVAAAQPKDPLTGEYGELVIDEPSCFSIGFQLLIYADDVPGEITEVSNVRRNAPSVQGADNFLHGGLLYDDRPILDQTNTLQIPLVRLAWRYTGDAVPVLSKDLMGDTLSDDLLRRPLLRLPDPAAEATVYVRTDAQFEPVAIFRAQALPALNPEAMSPMTRRASPWGSLWAVPRIKDENEDIQLSTAPAGKGMFVIQLDGIAHGISAKDLFVVWRMGDQQLRLPVTRLA